MNSLLRPTSQVHAVAHSHQASGKFIDRFEIRVRPRRIERCCWHQQVLATTYLRGTSPIGAVQQQACRGSGNRAEDGTQLLGSGFGNCDDFFWQSLMDGCEHMLVPCPRMSDEREGLPGSQGDRYWSSTGLHGLWKKGSPPRSEMGGRDMWSDAFDSKGGLERIESRVAR